jgi:hypothetical protein
MNIIRDAATLIMFRSGQLHRQAPKESGSLLKTFVDRFQSVDHVAERVLLPPGFQRGTEQRAKRWNVHT